MKNVDKYVYTCYNYYKKEVNRLKDKDLLKALQKDGWQLVRVNGSHHILQKGQKTETIPVHGKDVPKGLLSAILKRTGLK